MDVAVTEAVASLGSLALQALASLHIAGFLWPPQTFIKDEDTYDYIVVGVGTSGSILVNRLSEDGRYSVLGIDKGDNPPVLSIVPGIFPLAAKSNYDWNYTGQHSKYSCKYTNYGERLTSGKVLGGSSSIGHLLYTRGPEEDFNTWAEIVGDETWKYLNVLPYFIKAENMQSRDIRNSKSGIYHGVNGPIKLNQEPHKEENIYYKTFKELGYNIVPDLNEKVSVGYTRGVYPIANSVRQSNANAYLTPIKTRANVHIRKRTLVKRIIFDENKNAIGVEAITEFNKNIILRARKEVIVAAGAIKSPQLLMLSGIGPRMHLQNMNIDVISNLPVGENFIDQLATILFYQTEHKLLPSLPPNPVKFPFPTIIGFVALNKSQTYPDYQSVNFLVPNLSIGLPLLCSLVLGYRDEICQRLVDANKGRSGLVTGIVNLLPQSRGFILLQSTNPEDQPLIFTRYYEKDSDLENTVKYIEQFSEIINSTYFKNVGANLVNLEIPECSDFKFASHDYWRCYALNIAGSLYHYQGTCALGSVVDKYLRVKSVGKLRVVDASVFPTPVRANPMAAVNMLGEKGAQLIINDQFEV